MRRESNVQEEWPYMYLCTSYVASKEVKVILILRDYKSVIKFGNSPTRLFIR